MIRQMRNQNDIPTSKTEVEKTKLTIRYVLFGPRGPHFTEATFPDTEYGQLAWRYLLFSITAQVRGWISSEFQVGRCNARLFWSSICFCSVLTSERVWVV